MDQFTVKAQEALASAQTDAERSDHPEVAPEHLLKALLSQEGGVVPSALGKLGANTGGIATDVDQKLASLPQAKGSATHVSPQLDATLKQALREAEALKDQYVSSEHLLLGLAESSSPAGKSLGRHGVARDRILSVLREIRGRGERLPVIVLTARTGVDDTVASLDGGADRDDPQGDPALPGLGLRRLRRFPGFASGRDERVVFVRSA